MIAVARQAMSRTGGTRKHRDEGTTRMVRIQDDLADMLGWIVRLKGGTAARHLDPLIRKWIEDEYGSIEKEAETIKRAEAKHRPAGSTGAE